MLTKGEVFIGTAIDYTSEGLGVVKKDQQVIFVNQLIKGEEAKIKIVHAKKNIAFGDVVELINKSDARQENMCEAYPQCGGCNLLHINYETQKEIKTNIVKNNFSKFAKLDIKIDNYVQSKEVGYRNKASYPIQFIDGKYVFGFYKVKTNEIIEHQKCLNQDDDINKAIVDIVAKLNKIGYDFHIKHIVIRKVDQGLNVLIVTKNKTNKIMKFIKEYLTNYHSVAININQTTGNKIIDGEIVDVIKPEQNFITISGKKFNVSYESFFQVNQFVTSKLYEQVFNELNKDQEVLELYCGTGTISLICADKAKSITAVEIVEQAVNDANANKKLNNITNVNFLAMDATQYLDNNTKQFDTLIIDPPRKGLEAFAYEHIKKANPNKIIYVSCSSDTLARDVKELESAYKLESIKLVDMFPNTKHIETIATLVKK